MKFFTKIKGFRFWSNQDGFTLTEALISVALLSTGLMAYGTLSGSIIERNTHSERASIATTLAQDKIEEIRNMTVGGISLNNAVGLANPKRYASNWINGTTENLDSEGGNTGTLQYARQWQITKPTASQVASAGRDGGTGTVDIYDLQVTVSWNNNGPHQVVLNTRIND